MINTEELIQTRDIIYLAAISWTRGKWGIYMKKQTLLWWCCSSNKSLQTKFNVIFTLWYVQFLWNEIFWSAHTCGISSSHTLPPRCSWLFKAFKLEPRIALPKYFARDLCFKVGWFYSASICLGVPRQVSLICPLFAGWSVGRCNASVLFINFLFSPTD